MANKEWVGGSTATPGTSETDWSDGANWSSTDVPVAGDDVTIPAKSIYAISNGTTSLSTVIFGSFKVEDGYLKTIGVTTGAVPTYLEIVSPVVEFSGGGEAYISLPSSTDVLAGSTSRVLRVFKTAPSGGAGTRGLYARGFFQRLEVLSGDVGHGVLASDSTNAGQVKTLRVQGGKAVIGDQSAVTTVEVVEGECLLQAGTTDTTIKQSGGVVTVDRNAAFKSWDILGGNGIHQSSTGGDEIDCQGGEIDFRKGASVRTFDTLRLRGGAVTADANTVTFSTIQFSTDSYRVDSSQV